MLAPHFEKNWLVARKLAYEESGSNECARCMRREYTWNGFGKRQKPIIAKEEGRRRAFAGLSESRGS